MRVSSLLTACVLWAGVVASAYVTSAGIIQQPKEGESRAVAEPASSHTILAISSASVYPNPFNPFSENATIAFSLTLAAEMEITVYDWGGEFVDTVFMGSGVAGVNFVPWGGQTEDGRKLGNGVYLIRVVARNQARTESTVIKVAVWNDG